MSLIFNPDSSVQLPAQNTFTSSADATNLNEWSKLGNIIYNTALANVGIGTTNPNGFKLNVLGSINATSLYGNGANITNVPYSTITGKPTNFQSDWTTTIINKPTIYTQTEVNNLLSAKEATLTFNSPLTRTTNTIGINLNSYPTFTQLNSCNFITNSTNSLTNYYNKTTSDGKYTQSNFTPSYTQLNSCNFITNSTNSLTNYYNKTTSDGKYTTKQATLAAATNLLGVGSAITALDYNNITLNKPTNFQSDWTTSIINKPSIYTQSEITTFLSQKENVLTFNSPLTRTTNTIGINLNSYPTFTQLNSCNYASTGSFLALSGGTLTGNLTLNYTNINFQLGGTTGNNIAIPSSAGFFSTSAAANDMVIRSTNNLHLLSGTGNSAITIKATTNNVGIAIANPQFKLHITAAKATPSTAYAMKVSGGAVLDSGNHGTLVGLCSEDSSFCKNALGHVRTGTYDRGGIVFLCNNIADGTSATMTDEKMRIRADGNVGIGTNNPNNILQVGAGGRLRISNTNSDYTLIGTQDTDTDTNTRIVLSGNGRIGANGFIDYNTTSTGHHIFNTTDARTERMRITSGGGVGIGTNDPLTYKLNVNGTSYFNDVLTIASAANGKYLFASGLRIAGSDGNTLYNDTYPIGITALNTISLITGTSLANYATRLKIATNGNIGIGTEPSAYNFHINGTTKIESSLNVGALTTAGNVNLTGTWAFNCYGPAMFDYDLSCRLLTTSQQNPHDYVGITSETSAGSTGVYTLRTILNSFTGFHRNFTNDELFDENDPQLFKDNYEGRIVVATGKIATQTGNEKDGYEIKYDKDGIFTEDAHPLIQLSRKKKDKRVFGVLGRNNRKNSNEKRMIINSVGEGAIWVCNYNGNIENGDYIQSSDYLGYGEKQDDDLLHNYSVAKSFIDCSFELDNSSYNCFEINDLDANGNKLRIAFIACSYHCA
jgi:hypothetical protein